MDFELIQLGELAAPVKNAIVGGPFGSNLVSKDYVASGIPVIRGQNMGDRWVGGEFVFVSREKAEALSPNKARPGDLVFTQRGTLGQVSIVPQSPFSEYIVSQSQMKVTVDPKKVDVNFLYYVFRSPEQLEYIKNTAIQTGVPHTNLGILKKTPIKIPSILIQCQIAAILGSLDDRIALLRETNATLEAIAQALFKSWFVDFGPVRAKMESRFPEGMDKATAALFPDEFEESELGLAPKGWCTSNLATLASQHGGSIQTGPFGSQLHAYDYASEGTPVVMPKDIANRRISTDSIARVSSEHVVRLGRHQLASGDIVFSRRGDVERHALVTPYEAGWLCGTGCLLVRPGSSWRWPAYLSMLLDTPQARTWLVQRAVGATMPNLNTGILGSIPLVVPPADILDKFEQVAIALEERRSENLATIDTLSNLRDTLLPRLISGRLSLPAAVEVLEAA